MKKGLLMRGFLGIEIVSKVDMLCVLYSSSSLVVV